MYFNFFSNEPYKPTMLCDSSGKGSAGGTPEAGLTGDSNYKGSIKNVEDLVNMQDRKAYNEIGQAISRFHAVLGVRERQIKLADLSQGFMGVQANMGGENAGIYLNKAYFKDKTSADIKKGMRAQYDEGWQTRTNKPVAHVVTHELAHALWNSSKTTPNAIKAGKEIKKLSAKWMADKTKQGYGKYSKTNLDEFFAEVTTKAVHGTADQYTKAVKRIIKKYNL